MRETLAEDVERLIAIVERVLAGEPIEDVLSDANRDREENGATRPRIVTFEETGEERVVSARCFRCGVTDEDVSAREIVVSPSGRAHFGADYGMTICGKDATGNGWWWPL